jgi:hypothetical protein
MTTRVVSEGRVHCPRDGDLSVDHCWSCGLLKELRIVGDLNVLECRGTSPLAAPLVAGGYITPY